ncbi:chemotaxis protein CheA [Erythrobacter sp. THAF29]|uniref:chemotaxis protein CheA n=1 Tax=Erythrobacter sp. THAF29 TaxID=2587851 RepID=UPI00126882D9|nr:chemotaxis protein CheA [Erythrobacter sp. THAF29]QFT76872.1 Chemotaxis protein CheA [Erythrobacter sp. THAF29]
MDDLLADFVAETREMLEASEGEIIAWEADPSDRARIDTIFRFVHTVKGNCGFFDFPRLAGLSHAAEDALAECRAGRREADSALVSAVLAIIDRIVQMVDAIEAGDDFPEGGDEALIAALQGECEASGETEPAPVIEATRTGVDGDDAKPASPTVQRSIRLPVDLLDRVMSGVSDMVLARNDLGHRLRQAGNQPTIDGPFERLTAILTDVRDAITRMRMQRIETLFAAFPRLVRDLSAELGKQVMVDIEGGDVELDREMVEMVRDPLTHIIRNAIDHGIEAPSDRLKDGKREIGLLSIAARQAGNTISIVVSDDGRGLDEKRIAAKAASTGLISEAQAKEMGREKILQLIFEPGFSTAESVSNVSGRGVGLDVVRDNLEKVGGSIKVSSQPGVGTLFTLQIPLTLSIIAGLTVEVGEQCFAIPQSFVEEIVHSSAKALDFTRVGETALITFRGNRVPCLMLSEVLGLPKGDLAEGDHTMVLLRLASGDVFALAVDRIHNHGDLVVKPLAPAVMKAGVYAGSTLLDDGQPVLLLDVTNIASAYDLVSDARMRVKQAAAEADEKADREAVHAMLFTRFDGRRCAVRLKLVKRIETASADAIDLSGRVPRAVIDNEILPLIGLPEGQLPAAKVRLLRLSDGESELLHAVRDVDDAVDLAGKLKPVSDDPLIEAVTLVEDKTVSLIDAHEIFAQFGESPEAVARPTCRIPDSDWARTILAPLVESAGYEVVETSGEPDGDGSEVVIMLEEEYEAAAALEIPLSDRIIRLRSLPQGAPGEDTIYRYDREALVNALRDARKPSGAAA